MAIPIDAQGWLVPGQYGSVKVIRHPPISKISALASDLNGKPLGIVWHWTAGGYGSGTGTESTNYFISESYNAAKKASWHFLINRRGEIHQFAPIYVGTWTTGSGGSLFDRVAGIPTSRKFSDVNRATIGVELENAGVLLPYQGAWYAWPYGIGAEGLSELQAREAAAAGKVAFKSAYKVDASRAVPWGDGNTYDRWPDLQILAAQEMSRAVAGALGWTDPERIHYGHRTFYSKRDPGLLWMDGVLPQIEKNIFGRAAGGIASSPNTPLFLLALAGAGFLAFWKYRRS
jgi:hypothetical protein